MDFSWDLIACFLESIPTQARHSAFQSDRRRSVKTTATTAAAATTTTTTQHTNAGPTGSPQNEFSYRNKPMARTHKHKYINLMSSAYERKLS